MLKPLLSIIVLATATTFAGTPSQSASINKEIKEEESIFDRLWKIPTIYHNEENPFIQEVRITGRAHLDVFSLDSNLGADSDWIFRRLRMGTKIRLFQKMELNAELDFNPQNPDPFYTRLTNANLSWKFNDAFKLTLGKQSANFTLDGATSSNELLTIDRNNLSNNFWFTNEYFTGASLSGKVGQFQYSTGVFSGGTYGNEFGNIDAGNFYLASVGYDFGKMLGFKKALLRADYVHNERNIESNGVRPFENVASLNFQLAAERWGISSDVTGATGYLGQSDAWGFAVMPWFNITKNLQLVARYTYLNSENPNGIRFNRYENVIAGVTKGDEYNEFYAGLNYYIYGHKLKLQTGLTYADMNDNLHDGGQYHGWCWTSGLRLSF